MAEFQINQIFEDTYPPEAADWCNTRQDCYITELDLVNGKRRFQIIPVPEPTAEEKAARALAKAKQERADAVSKITVKVDGMTFDGDETAQTRMGRTIAAAVALGVDLQNTKHVWILADNTVAQPTIAQLAQALKLAGEAQTKLWPNPYEAS